MLQKLEKASVPARQPKRLEGDRSGRALLLIGLWIAAMGHSGFYHFVTGRDGGDMDHPGSWGSF